MKIAFLYNSFSGGFQHSIEKSLTKLGHETFTISKFNAPIINKMIRRIEFNSIKNYGIKVKEELFNRDFLRQMSDYKPDIFINYSGSGLFPSSVKTIKENTKCLIICYMADNPCDPHPWRDKYFPMTLQYYDIFLNPEPVWDKLIYNLCANPKIIRFYGGYDPENFFPIEKNSISIDERNELECEVSFTGSSYNKSAEGAYRSGILGAMEDYNVKIWGDEGWKYRFSFLPKIKNAYQGNRLSYEKLRKLYTISKINLNMPSPQIFTSFQPRVFDIAATKGFQIVDHSNELYNIFEKNEVVTFSSIQDLKNKINFYRNNEELRFKIVEQMYDKIKDEYTWENQIKILLQQI